MKKFIVFLIVGILLVSTSVLSFADSVDTPAEILENLTELTLEDINDKRGNGVRIGDISKEYGVYDEFKTHFLEEKFDVLKTKLEAGEISQEEFDTLVSLIENCDGTGTGKTLENVGMQFGRSNQSGFGRNMDSQGRGYKRNN